MKEIHSLTSTTYRQPNTFDPSASALLAQWIVNNILAIIGLIVATGTALFIHYDGKSIEESEYKKVDSEFQKIIDK